MRSDRNSTSRLSTGTRVGYTGSLNPGILPSYKMDWQKTTGTSITGLSSFTPGFTTNKDQSGAVKEYHAGTTGHVILESDIADFNKYSAMARDRRNRDGVATYNNWLSQANQRTIDALNNSATHNLGPVRFAQTMDDFTLKQTTPDRSNRFQSGTEFSSVSPTAGQTFKWGQYGDRTADPHGQSRPYTPTGVYSESRASRTEYSSTIPGTAVGQGGKDPRDRRYLAINKDVNTDNSLQATQTPSTPGDLLKRKMQSFGKIGRVSMPSGGGGAGEEPRLNISASGVTGLNFN
jgi:hypothetical protein